MIVAAHLAGGDPGVRRPLGNVVTENEVADPKLICCAAAEVGGRLGIMVAGNPDPVLLRDKACEPLPVAGRHARLASEIV